MFDTVKIIGIKQDDEVRVGTNSGRCLRDVLRAENVEREVMSTGEIVFLESVVVANVSTWRFGLVEREREVSFFPNLDNRPT